MFALQTTESVTKLFHAFDIFSEASGRNGNPTKSSIYFGGVDRHVQNVLLRDLGLSKEDLPFRYIGVPLSFERLTIMQCQRLIRKVLARIDSWTAKLPTYAGRVQLIKAVLFNIQTFWCQVVVLPLGL